jgi:hypothetical protein
MWWLRLAVAWLVLVVTGWLAYALIRALATIILLDVPVFDWQWYVPVIALSITGPMFLTYRWMRRRSIWPYKQVLIAFAILLVWAIMGYNGFSQTIQLNPDRAAPIEISFWAFSDFRSTPDSVLQDIQLAKGRVYLDIGRGPYGQGLVAAMRHLAEYGIEVYWMPEAADFLSTPVYLEWIAYAREAAALIKHENLSNVRGLIGDVEPPLNLPLALIGADRSQFDQAVIDLRGLMVDLNRDEPDLKIGVTTTWAHFVDALDGDADLSVVMRSPLDPPGGWDFVNLMTYSSYVPLDWRAYDVYLHEQAMAKLYPRDRVSHLIGLVGGGMPGEPAMGFDDLVRDARISRALGVREIVVFQLDGALKVFGEDFVRRFVGAVNGAANSVIVVSFSRPASIVFYATALADALLDVRGPRVWIWIAWIIVSGAIALRWTRNV